jgi:hypothetical protein
MIKRYLALTGAAVVFLCLDSGIAAEDQEIVGVTFPGEVVVDGKALELNGVACRRAFLVVKVYAAGLYLERPTQDPQEAIESEQIKRLHLHYLTDRVTAARLQDGFVKTMEEANPPELVERYRAEIETYASWFDQDVAPGTSALNTYVPGKGLTLTFNGEVKGTIPDKEFAQMYFRYNLGPGADSGLRKGYLGPRQR